MFLIQIYSSFPSSHKLTNFNNSGASWEPNSSSASQEIPLFFLGGGADGSVLYSQNLPFVPVLCQINSFHTSVSILTKTYWYHPIYV